MTFLELVVKLRKECSVSGVGPVSLNDNRAECQRLVNWIRNSNIEIQGKYANWKFLWREGELTTEADKSRYVKAVDLPGNVRVYREETFRHDGQPLTIADWYDFRDTNPTLTYGAPEYMIAVPNGDLQVYPTPDKAYSIEFEYYSEPQILTEQDEVPWIPVAWHKLIVYRGMMMYADYENAPEVKQAGMDGYTMLLLQLEASQLPQQGDMGMVNEYDIVVQAS